MERYRDSMSESALMNAIVTAARRLNYLVYHTRHAQGSEPGFPDLLIVGHGKIIAWELKTAKGKLRPRRITNGGRVLPGQEDWLAAFQRANIIAGVIRPDGLDWALEMLQQEVDTS